MTSLHDITAVILAGGLGTRLRTVVADRPKILANVCGRPFVAWLLDRIASSGIRKCLLCTGYMADQVCTTLGNEHNDMQIEYSRELEQLGTGGALRLALPLLDSSPILVLNGDTFCNVEYAKLLAQHELAGATATLTLTNVADTSRYGVVITDNYGVIEKFEEKGTYTEPGTINAGVYLLDHSIVAGIPPSVPYSLEREIFPGLIGKGLYGFLHEGSFIDIGVPDDYRIVQDFFSASTTDLIPEII